MPINMLAPLPTNTPSRGWISRHNGVTGQANFVILFEGDQSDGAGAAQYDPVNDPITDTFFDRHKGGMNLLFADGHVIWVKADQTQQVYPDLRYGVAFRNELPDLP